MDLYPLPGVDISEHEVNPKGVPDRRLSGPIGC